MRRISVVEDYVLRQREHERLRITVVVVLAKELPFATDVPEAAYDFSFHCLSDDKDASIVGVDLLSISRLALGPIRGIYSFQFERATPEVLLELLETSFVEKRCEDLLLLKLSSLKGIHQVFAYLLLSVSPNDHVEGHCCHQELLYTSLSHMIY